MNPRSNILLGSLIADALALGPHWIYEPAEIHRKLGRVTGYAAPLAVYHTGKNAGDFTHYGDQTMVLLRSIAALGHFDFADFAGAWQALWENPATVAYRDGATRTTLAQVQAGTVASATISSSHEIAGAARIAPLLLLKWQNDGELLAAVRAQTRFTHGDPAVIEAAEFFARVCLTVIAGSAVDQALKKTMSLSQWQHLPADALSLATESARAVDSDSQALHHHGLACSITDAFPCICHLLLRYPQDPVRALIENVNAGGDSAARGMILGMIYGAAFPLEIWPTQWLTDLNVRVEIESLLDQLLEN